MEYTDIFRQLLRTEAAARAIHDEAQALQSEMTTELNQLIHLHRKQAYEKADAQIAQAEQAAIHQANVQIARLDEDARGHIAKLRETEAQNQSSWVRQIYLAATYQEA